MINKILLSLFAFSLALLIGCGSSATVITKGGPTIKEARSLSPTSKIRIAVMDFDNRTKYSVGQGMSAMLTSALFETNKFIVLEREELRDVLLEQKLGESGIVNEETKAPTGEVEGAEILVYGTVTEFEPAAQGVVTQAGGVQQSHVAIDLKLVDTKTSRVVSTTTVTGKATDISLSTKNLQYAGVSPLYFMQMWANTPIESAIRLCIEEGVNYIINNIE